MNEEQKQLVQSSFQAVLPLAEQAAELFYNRLFELDPALHPMFRGDMQEQGRKLMSALKLAVAGLNELEKIVPALQHLGRKHIEYGVQEVHYETVGEALIWTLKQGLGNRFTSEVEWAWIAAYRLLSDVMQGAARQEAVALK